MPARDRRAFLARSAGAAALLTLPTAARAASGKTHRILMITFRGETDVEKGFRDHLAASGVKADLVVRDVNRDVKNVPAILEEAAKSKPDLIYTWGTPVTLAVVGPHDSPKLPPPLEGVPLVFALVAAPVQAKIVPTLSGHGRNLTGAVHVVPTDVQLRAMNSYRPFKKIGVLYTESEQNSRAIVAQARDYLRTNGGTLIERTFQTDASGKPTADGIEDKVAEIRRDGADWLYLLPDTFLGSQYARLSPAAIAQKLPTFGAAELAVRSGGALVGLVSRYRSVGQLAAARAIDILENRRPASSLPIETLKRFSLIVNLRTAKALGGVYPPIDMLNYAEIIEDAPATARTA